MADSTKCVWVPDEQNLFRKGVIISENAGMLKVRVEGSSDILELDASKTEKVNPEQFDQVGDMAELTYLNEPSVVNNLHTRWENGKIYTYSGLFLVAVNPYRDLPIYDNTVIANFKDKRRDEADPHIYAIAEQAICNLRETKRDQSILITGESGAGKTENTKKAIQYLSSITNCASGGIDEKIIQTNPILEAFGNAQTIRNSNSSRFGKFIKIQFDRDSGSIAGASIQWYLLEKSRVVTQHSDERNYHIFYQLLSGAPAEVKSQLLIPHDAQPKDFNYLAKSTPTINGVNDSASYQHLVEAFKVMGFRDSEVFNVMSLVACVLLLGQVQFRASSADQGAVSDMKDVEKVCELLGVEPSNFVNAILKPKVKTGRQFVTQSRNADQAHHTTNAIAKALYERLFGYIVSQLNVRLGEKDKSAASIGVLDIAGFEIFDQNSFEQLCINYTNEKLQQFFNHHMFVLEQEEYIKQKVDWEYVDYGADLQPTIDLIEQSKAPMGIFSCLNEESALLSGSDTSFNSKLVDQWKGKNPKFEPSRLGQGFTIHHYAQPVEYQTDGWMEKNKDPLSDAAESMLADSTNSLIRSLFAPSTPNTPGAGPASPVKGKSMLFRTVAQKHKEQLNSLMSHLQATHPHFVRCILPNTAKSPNVFDNRLVLDQLRCNGVLEGIRIARSGFPNRVEFQDFCQRYRALAGQISGPFNSQHTAATILQRIKLDPSTYKVGLSKVFFRNGVLAELEHRLDNLVREQVLAVQTFGRGALVREAFNSELHRKRAGKVLARSFRVNLKNASDPWWRITTSLKPLLLSKEGMDNSRKDMRMQKLEGSVNRLREEQVELVSSRNELRAELISALRSKEDLIEEIEHLRKEQGDVNEAHEFAINAARSRDEASTAALSQLSQQHTKLKDEYDELMQLKEKVESEFDQKLRKEASDADEKIAKLASEQKNSLGAVEKLLEDAKNEVSEHKREISELKASMRRSEAETVRAFDEVASLKDKLASAAKMEEKLKLSKEEVSQLEKNLTEAKDLNATLKSDIEKLNSSKSQHSKESSELKAAIEEKTSSLSKLQETYDKLKLSHNTNTEEATKTKSLLEEKSNKLKTTSGEVTKLRDWLSKAKNEIKAAAATTKELSALKETHESTLAKLKVAETSLVATEADISQLKERLDKSADPEEVEKYKTKLAETEIELNSASEKIKRYESETAKLENDLKSTREELEKSQNGTKDYQAKLEKSISEKSSVSNELEKARSENTKATGDFSDLKKKYEKLVSELKESKSEASALSMTVSKSIKSDEFEAVKSDLQKRSSEVEQLKKELASRVQRSELDDALSKATVAKSEIEKLKSELASSVTKESYSKLSAELEAANGRITEFEAKSANSADKSELAAASDRIKRLEADIDLANENLLKINDELNQSQTTSAKLQNKYDSLMSSTPDLKNQLKESQSAYNKAQAEVNALKSSSAAAVTNARDATKELESLKKSSQNTADKLKFATEKNTVLEREAKQNIDELATKKRDVERLELMVASFNTKLSDAIAEKDKELASLSAKLASTKDELLKMQTRAIATPGVSPTRKRFVSSDTEQQLADTSHNAAQLEASVASLTRDLAIAKNENAKSALVQQKYEKVLHDKKALVQELSKLRLERGFSARNADISEAQGSLTKKLESEVKLLSLELARKEKAIKALESSSRSPSSSLPNPDTSQSDSQLNAEITSLRKSLRLTELKNVQLEKQVKLAQRHNGIAVDRSEVNDGGILVSKTRSTDGFRDITNDRRVSGNHSPSGLDNETADVYRERANDYLSKLEKAEMVIDAALRGEKSAKSQMQGLKERLARFEDDHSAEVERIRAREYDARLEIDKRDSLIKDLKGKAALSSQLERDIKASALKMRELQLEKTRLSTEKSRLESKLNDLLANSDLSTRKKDEQIISLRHSERQMLREHSELRWKLERKDRLVDQLRGSLADADARSDELRDELERFKSQDLEKDVSLRRINRQLSEAKDRYLTAERRLEDLQLHSSRTPRDHNQPAFI